MSATFTLRPAAPGFPVRLAWWGVLLAATGAYLTLGWLAALGIVMLAILQAVRPLDFLISYLMVVLGGTLVDYTRGHLTRDMSVLTVVIVFMLFCYLLSRRDAAPSAPRSRLTVPLLLFLGLTLANFIRGVLVGNSLRYAGLELIATLAIGSALLIGSLRMTRREIGTALIGIWIVAMVNSVLGFYIFSVIHQRTGSIFFLAVPGLVALMLFNFALREPRAGLRWLWLLAITPLLMHQFLSFTRGFWLGLMGGLLFSILAYGGFGPGSARRWGRTIMVFGALLVLGLCGGVVLSQTYGISNLFTLAASRLSSSASTKLTFETSSNIVRLVEYARAITEIMASPWLGRGLGFYFVVREPIHLQLLEQWFVHETYLLVWLKQGVIGLALFVWMLLAAIRTGFDGSRSEDAWKAAWCAGSAAATVYVVIHCMVYFTLAEVNTAFLMALFWGGSMAITSSGTLRVRWRATAR